MQKNAKRTKPIASLVVDDDLHVPEFDFSRAKPNRFAERCAKGTTRTITTSTGKKKIYVSLDADVAKKFRSSKSVNETLRSVIKQESRGVVKVA